MIHLKRILEIILALISVPVCLFSLFIILLIHPFYIMIHYIIYGNFGKNLYDIMDKMIDIIFKPLKLLEKWLNVYKE